MLIGIGTDILKISRLSPQALAEGDPFVTRAYTEAERAEASGREQPLWYYADRFAGKEAVYKAVSACGAEFRPGDIEILNDADGRPHARLLGTTRKKFENCCGKEYAISVSLSYDTEYAMAFAAAEKL